MQVSKAPKIPDRHKPRKQLQPSSFYRDLTNDSRFVNLLTVTYGTPYCKENFKESTQSTSTSEQTLEEA